MKNTVLLLCIFLQVNLFAGKEKDKQVVVLAGQITNAQSDTLFIKDAEKNLVKKIALVADKSFKESLIISEGYYTLSDGNERTTLYLKPGFNVYLTIDTKQFDESIHYTGLGSAENNYLAKSYLLEESFGRLSSYSYYAKLDEKEFLHLEDSLLQVQMNLLNSNKASFTSSLAYWEALELQINYKRKLSVYESMHRFLSGDMNYTVSESFPDPFSGLDMNRDSLLRFVNYENWISEYISFKTKAYLKEHKGEDFYIVNAQTIKQTIKSEKIRDELAYDIVRNQMKYTKHLDSLRQILVGIIKNPEYLNVLEINYQKIKRTSKGQKAPSFAFKDREGKTVTLEDFKGKLVFIDVWATWCVPCVKDIPDLKALQDSLKGQNIVFVSISRNDNVKRWNDMIEKEDLQGVHLFAENGDDPFFTELLIPGVPAYLIINADGNILNANAQRPSSPFLYQEILSYLNQ